MNTTEAPPAQSETGAILTDEMNRSAIRAGVSIGVFTQEEADKLDPNWKHHTDTDNTPLREAWNEIEVLREQRSQLETELAAAAAENARLRDWKESAMAVEREWDAQAIAKMLGGTIGQSCRKIVAEAVPKLLQQLSSALAACAQKDVALRKVQWARDHDCMHEAYNCVGCGTASEYEGREGNNHEDCPIVAALASTAGNGWVSPERFAEVLSFIEHDAGIVCNCNFNEGHEAHCRIVRAHNLISPKP